MAFQDKFRALVFGLHGSVPSVEVAGEKVLLFRDLPYELENAFTRWLMLQDELLYRDTPACVIRFDERDRIGVMWAAWGHFLDWMSAQLSGSSEGQGSSPDAAHALREGMAARTPISELRDEPVLYLDAVPLELRAALRHWLDASPEDFVRHDDSGRAAITWDGWEGFLRSMRRTLSVALDALEQAREPAAGI